MRVVAERATVKVYNRSMYTIKIAFDFDQGSDFEETIPAHSERNVPINVVGTVDLRIGARYKDFATWKPVFSTPVSRRITGGTALALGVDGMFKAPEVDWQ